MPEPARNDLAEHVVSFGFNATLNLVLGAIKQAGLFLFATIDHAEGAHALGVRMRPTTVLIYGHPKGGTPIMLETPKAALDLPLRVLVRELEDGRSAVSFHPMAVTLERLGVPNALLHTLDPAQRVILEALV